MSFGIGIGDIVLLSDLAHKLGTTLTSGRKGATAEFQDVQNQLFAIGKALKFASGIVESPKSPEGDKEATLEDEIFCQMIENCGVTLKHLDGVLKKYPELRADAVPTDDKTQQRWLRELKDNIKKIKFTTEGGGIDKLRNSLGIHVTALNLAITACNHVQAGKSKLQAEASNAKLEDMHEWFVTNIKFASEESKGPRKAAAAFFRKPAAPSALYRQQTNDSVSSISISIDTPSESSGYSEALSEADFEGPERHVSFRRPDEEELTFSVSLKPENAASSYLICSAASLNPEWMRIQDSRLFHCSCGRSHNLDFTLVPLSVFVRITTRQPTWTIYASSKSSNSVVQLLISNVLSTRLADFEQHRFHLALVQGLRSASAGANPDMLIYTSTQDIGGSLSVLNSKSGTSNFRNVVRNATIQSKGLEYSLGVIESVQLLHYMSLLFPGPDGDAMKDNPGLLPCQNAEIVIQTKVSPDSGGGDLSQLVVQFGQLSVVDKDISKSVVTLKNVDGKAFVKNDDRFDRIDIQDSDIELTFTSTEAATSFLNTIESLQRHLFISYLQSQRLEETIKFQRNIGDVMIREMQLLDAVATMVEDPTNGEQRMIISSKCGSKFVTVIVPPAAAGSASSIEGPRIGPDVSAFFVNEDAEDTRIVKQSFGAISNLGLFLVGDTGAG
ncbi:hypothetical protein V494_08248 [Pseudogymnoascus sp. VKM F-4513 (FW-928)]|nr:hypothetical protein V494_08248 [Pseudogymnoascus sp. VKM F-4513 (FW-928)]